MAKSTHIYSVTVLEARNPKSVSPGRNQGVGRAVRLRSLFLVSSSFLRLPAFLGLSVSLQTLSPWSHHFLLFYIYLLSLCLSLLRALVMAFKPHLGNTGSSPHLVHLMILNHICKDPLSTYSHIYRSMVKTWISFGWAFSASHSACMYLLHN